jgi:hypothetical protein
VDVKHDLAGRAALRRGVFAWGDEGAWEDEAGQVGWLEDFG